jgi:hypothetical protein
MIGNGNTGFYLTQARCLSDPMRRFFTAAIPNYSNLTDFSQEFRAARGSTVISQNFRIFIIQGAS